jgi:hypothetical protein
LNFVICNNIFHIKMKSFFFCRRKVLFQCRKWRNIHRKFSLKWHSLEEKFLEMYIPWKNIPWKLEMKISLELEISGGQDIHQNSCNFKYFSVVIDTLLCLAIFFNLFKRVMKVLYISIHLVQFWDGLFKLVLISSYFSHLGQSFFTFGQLRCNRRPLKCFQIMFIQT